VRLFDRGWTAVDVLFALNLHVAGTILARALMVVITINQAEKTMMEIPHGQPNNINICTLDVDSDITSHAQHNRLLVCGHYERGAMALTVREDILHGLPMSTEEQRRKVMNGWQRLHARNVRLQYVSTSERYFGGDAAWESIDHVYHVKR
jgi:hypothetical protein